MAVEGGGDYRRRLVRRKQAAKQNKAARERAFSTPAPPRREAGVSGATKGYLLDWAEPITKSFLNTLGATVHGFSAAQGTTSFGGSATQIQPGTDPRVARVLGDTSTLGTRLTSAALEAAPVDEAAKAQRRELWASPATPSTFALAGSDFLPDPIPPGAAGLAAGMARRGLGSAAPNMVELPGVNVLADLIDRVQVPKSGVTKNPTKTEDVVMVDTATRKRLRAQVKSGQVRPEVVEALETPLPVVANQEAYKKALTEQLGDVPVVAVKGKVDKTDLSKYPGSIVFSTNVDGTVNMATPPVFVDDLGVPHFLHNYPGGVRNAAGERWSEGLAGFFDEANDLRPEVKTQMEENLANMFLAGARGKTSPNEWYPFFHENLVKDLSEKNNLSEWQIAGLLSALSPQTPFPVNVADAVDLLKLSGAKKPRFSEQSLAALIQTLARDPGQIAAAGSKLKIGSQSGQQTLTGLSAIAGIRTPAENAIGKTPTFQWALFDPPGNALRTIGGPESMLLTREGAPVGASTFDIMMARGQAGQVINPGDLPSGPLNTKAPEPFNVGLSPKARQWAGLSGIAGQVAIRPDVAKQLKASGFKATTHTIQSEGWTQEQLFAALLNSLLGYGGYKLPKFT